MDTREMQKLFTTIMSNLTVINNCITDLLVTCDKQENELNRLKEEMEKTKGGEGKKMETTVNEKYGNDLLFSKIESIERLEMELALTNYKGDYIKMRITEAKEAVKKENCGEGMAE